MSLRQREREWILGFVTQRGAENGAGVGYRELLQTILRRDEALKLFYFTSNARTLDFADLITEMIEDHTLTSRDEGPYQILSIPREKADVQIHR